MQLYSEVAAQDYPEQGIRQGEKHYCCKLLSGQVVRFKMADDLFWSTMAVLRDVLKGLRKVDEKVLDTFSDALITVNVLCKRALDENAHLRQRLQGTILIQRSRNVRRAVAALDELRWEMRCHEERLLQEFAGMPNRMLRSLLGRYRQEKLADLQRILLDIERDDPLPAKMPLFDK